jgi:DNA repair and recombination protein RAD54B
MGKKMFNEVLLPGSTLSIGGKDIEVDDLITKEDYLAGRPFLKTTIKRAPSIQETPQRIGSKSLFSREENKKEAITVPVKSFYAPTPKPVTSQGGFKNPLLSTTVMPADKGGTPTPRHNPNTPNALVMKRPKHCPKGKQIVDVVVDPLLTDKLRPHQREGVKFLYECVMGLRDFNGQGALLADDMGLGKTLQTIALLWTLLKQNPFHGSGAVGGVIKKALVVCPVSLIDNWRKEFKYWLGNQNIGVFVADSQNVRLTDFTHGKSYSVMIIGYEKLRNIQEELKKGGGIDIVVADEGHRLKTRENKAAQAIRNLDTDRRIVLTGTPLQNSLTEYFVMVDFINPGLLGTYKTFQKEFEVPVMRGRQPGASTEELEKGEARMEEFLNTTKQFLLRRPASLLNEYLPPKTEYILFCKPTQAQAELYQHVLESPTFGKVLGSPEASLQLITILKKMCNSPTLLLPTSKTAAPSNSNVATLLESIPSALLRLTPLVASSKIRVLDRLLRTLSETTKEKIVLVSNYTSTLDVLGQHLSGLSLPFLRLDGSTPPAKRQALVNEFNRTPASKNFAFLLSAKSGGVGINLIGASRLVLFDVDWNPATDLQAMARIHRDGQKLPVKIYRFLMAGGMDEKIYQRQVTKIGLADSVIDGKESASSFSTSELRDLFRLDLLAGCQTHDLLGCDCKGLAVDPKPPPSRTEPAQRIADDDDDSSDDDLLFPLNPGFVPATKANMDAMDNKIAKDLSDLKKKNTEGKMQALMQYSHLNTSVFAGEKTDVFGFDIDELVVARKKVNDEVLLTVLEEKNSKVGYLFVKKG